MNKSKFGSCAKETRDEIIVCEEKRRKFIGKNNNRKPILKVEVDGCLITKGTRCDWLLVDIDGNIAHFIELKGNDLKKAFLQLEKTIQRISNTNNQYISTEFTKKYAYAVLSKCPLRSNDIDNKKVEFKRKLKTGLFVKNNEIKQNL
jgi:hypothetical protein